MDWLDSVQNIRRLKNENRLVILVGAGVSKNSDMPLWSTVLSQNERWYID